MKSCDRVGCPNTTQDHWKHCGSCSEEINKPQPTAFKEATITINGVELTHAQSMTLRVALGSFSISLSHEGLGDDKHGTTMVELYTARISEIVHLLSNTKGG